MISLVVESDCALVKKYAQHKQDSDLTVLHSESVFKLDWTDFLQVHKG